MYAQRPMEEQTKRKASSQQIFYVRWFLTVSIKGSKGIAAVCLECNCYLTVALS
jgi:hypothetical protein